MSATGPKHQIKRKRDVDYYHEDESELLAVAEKDDISESFDNAESDSQPPEFGIDRSLGVYWTSDSEDSDVEVCADGEMAANIHRLHDSAYLTTLMCMT